jgi:hypothetical protein
VTEVAILFEAVLILFMPVEPTHRRKLLLHPLEKGQNRISLSGQIKLGIYVHIQKEIITKRTVNIWRHSRKALGQIWPLVTGGRPPLPSRGPSHDPANLHFDT